METRLDRDLQDLTEYGFITRHPGRYSILEIIDNDDMSFIGQWTYENFDCTEKNVEKICAYYLHMQSVFLTQAAELLKADYDKAPFGRYY
jgi:hypothetical protein